MSLHIPCQFCGSRPVEFTFGEIPQVPEHISEPNERDLHRGFFFHNTEAEQDEAWFHVYGCRRWTYVKRNTVKDGVVKREQR